MSRVNTKERIREAATRLFLEQGYARTSIAAIERTAGLAPRAGAFYRHYAGKEALLIEIARSGISETPESFGLDGLAALNDTRAELVSIALRYEEAAVRQAPFARLIEEVRSLDFGGELQRELDANMMDGLIRWTRTKPAAQQASADEVAALVMCVFGGWLSWLTFAARGAAPANLRETMLQEWAGHWAEHLDRSR